MITLDGYAASHRAVDKLKISGILPRHLQVRSCKYLNNVIEQDHRRINQRVRPMLGFKRFETASVEFYPRRPTRSLDSLRTPGFQKLQAGQSPCLQKRLGEPKEFAPQIPLESNRSSENKHRGPTELPRMQEKGSPLA